MFLQLGRVRHGRHYLRGSGGLARPPLGQGRAQHVRHVSLRLLLPAAFDVVGHLRAQTLAQGTVLRLTHPVLVLEQQVHQPARASQLAPQPDEIPLGRLDVFAEEIHLLQGGFQELVQVRQVGRVAVSVPDEEALLGSPELVRLRFQLG